MCDATPMLRFESFETATSILSSVKATYMIKKCIACEKIVSP
ncbi:hypothetical protein BTJ45_05677 [Bacillus mycoides]|nr:hypothetical protein BTJ45_05677 [Bacillus mycoides]